MAQEVALRLGDIQLAGPTPQAGVDYRIEAMADGTHLGNPKALRDFVKSLFVDGSLAVLQGTDNREPEIRLRISAPESTAGPALAEAERVLTLATRKKPRPDALVYVPPAFGAAVTVFDTEAADLTRDNESGWDLEEKQREYRYFTLSLSCWPWARPENTVVVPAIAPNPPAPTTVNIDTCDVTTGWSKASQGFGPTTKTNLVANPSFETNQDGWAVGSGAESVFRESGAGAAVGTYYLHVYTSVGGAVNTMYANGPAVPVAPSTTYRIILSQRQSLSSTGGLLVRFYNGSGAQLGGDLVFNRSYSAGAWHAYETTVSSPAGAASLRLFPFMNEISGMPLEQPMEFDIDRIVVTVDDGNLGYIDGSLADNATWVYDWTGTAHASQSTATSTTPVPALSASGGHVDLTGTSSLLYSGSRSLTLTRTGAVAMSTSPYLRVSAAVNITGGSGATVFKLGTGSATVVTPDAIVPSAIAGYTDYYFATGDFDTLAIEVTASGGSNTPTATISVAHVARTDTIAGAGTLRQQARTAAVTGAAPTQAAIRLFDPTPAALGTDILVYTSGNTTWIPALRQYRTASVAPVADAAMVSGFKNTLATPMTFRFPANKVTEGTYSLLAKMAVAVAGTLSWTTRIVSAAGAATIGSGLTQAGSIALGVNAAQKVLNLGAMLLPPVAVEGDQMIELVLTGTADMTIDEAWLFSKDDGVLTWIPDTDSMTWVEIRSPEVGSDRPTIYGGTGARGANPVCIDWKTSSNPLYGACGQHITEPGEMLVFTVCASSTASRSELEFYPRYHSHVVDEAA